jgi:kynurenine formamidase
LDVDGTALLADLAAGASLARVLEFQGPQLRCFGAAPASSEALVVGDFNGRVDQGGSCNCSVLTLTPHANGTHTEGVGHLTSERFDAYRVIPQRLLLAVVLSMEPELAATSPEGSLPPPRPGDRLLTRGALLRAWPAPPVSRLSARALVVRTLPNERDKFAEAGADTAPFLSREAATWLVERGIEHLVVDIPSLDRGHDGGELTAHRIFFGLPRGSNALFEAQRRGCSVTELAYVADSISDGWYFLSLQSPAIAGDAVPTRPVLYPLRVA